MPGKKIYVYEYDIQNVFIYIQKQNFCRGVARFVFDVFPFCFIPDFNAFSVHKL